MDNPNKILNNSSSNANSETQKKNMPPLTIQGQMSKLLRQEDPAGIQSSLKDTYDKSTSPEEETRIVDSRTDWEKKVYETNEIGNITPQFRKGIDDQITSMNRNQSGLNDASKITALLRNFSKGGHYAAINDNTSINRLNTTENEDRQGRIFRAKALSYLQIPMYNSEEKANSDTSRKKGQVYGITSLNPNLLPLLKVEEKERSGDAYSQIRSIARDAKNYVKREGMKAGDALQEAVQGYGAGLGEVITILPELAMMTYPYAPTVRTDEEDGAVFGHKYSKLGWSMLGAVFSDVLPENLLVDEGEALTEFTEEVASRKEQVASNLDSYNNTISQYHQAFKELRIFGGVDYEKTFAGSFGKLLGEEMLPMRMLALRKFSHSIKYFEGSGVNLASNSPTDIANELNLTGKNRFKKAKKLLDEYKTATNPKLRALYLAREANAAVGFALGFSLAEQYSRDSSGNVSDEGSALAINMVSGFAGSVFNPQAIYSASGKARWSVSKNIYRILDSLEEQKLPKFRNNLGSVEAELRKTNPNISDADIKVVHAEREKEAVAKLKKRKIRFLQSYIGMTKADAIESVNNGDVDLLLMQEQLRRDDPLVDKMAIAISSMPEGKEKEEFMQMLEASYESLSEIVEYGRTEMGFPDLSIYISDIIQLQSFQNAKDQILENESTGFLKNMFKGSLGHTARDRLQKNEEELRESVSGFLLQITDHLNKKSEQVTLTTEDKISNLNVDATRSAEKFLVFLEGYANKLLSESSDANNALFDSMQRKILSRNDPDRITREAAASALSPEITTLTERTNTAEKLLFGTESGLPVKSADGFIPLEKRDKFEASKGYSTKEGQTDLIDVQPLVEHILNKYTDNKEYVDDIYKFIKEDVIEKEMTRVLAAVSNNTIETLDVEDLGFLKEVLIPTIKFESEDARTALLTQLDKLSPDNQLIYLTNDVAKNLTDDQKIRLLPVGMTLNQIQKIHSYTSRMSWSKGLKNPNQVTYIELGQSIDNLLDQHGERIQDPTFKDSYDEKRKLWKMYSDKWSRGPLGDLNLQDALGNKVHHLQELFTEFLEPTKIKENSEKFREFVKGTPIAIKNIVRDEKTNKITEYEVEYEPYTMDEVEAINNLLKQAISIKISSGTLNAEQTKNIRDTYSTILSNTEKKALNKYIDNLEFKDKADIDNATVNTQRILSQLRQLLKDRETQIDKSFLGTMTNISNAGVSSRDIVEKLFDDKIFSFHELTNEQKQRYANIAFFESGTAPRGNELSMKEFETAVGDTKQPDEKRLTGLEYLNIVTNGFSGVEGKNIKDQLEVMFTDTIVNELVKEAGSLVISKNGKKLTSGNEVELNNFSEIIGKIADARKKYGIINEDSNTIIDKVYKAALISKKREADSGKFNFRVPKEWTESMIISRVYAWQRGVVGLRYLLTEAGAKELRVKQVEQFKKLLTDPTAADVLMTFLRAEKPSTLRGRFKPSIRAMVIATGLRATEIALLFNPDQQQAFLENGDIDKEVISKAAAMGEARRKWKIRNQGQPTETQIVELFEKEKKRIVDPTGLSRQILPQHGKPKSLRQRAGFVTEEEAKQSYSFLA